MSLARQKEEQSGGLSGTVAGSSSGSSSESSFEGDGFSSNNEVDDAFSSPEQADTELDTTGSNGFLSSSIDKIHRQVDVDADVPPEPEPEEITDSIDTVVVSVPLFSKEVKVETPGLPLGPVKIGEEVEVTLDFVGELIIDRAARASGKRVDQEGQDSESEEGDTNVAIDIGKEISIGVEQSMGEDGKWTLSGTPVNVDLEEGEISACQRPPGRG